jgi:hypothetical protein
MEVLPHPYFTFSPYKSTYSLSENGNASATHLHHCVTSEIPPQKWSSQSQSHHPVNQSHTTICMRVLLSTIALVWHNISISIITTKEFPLPFSKKEH